MAKYRIVKHDRYDHIAYQVQKQFVGCIWLTVSRPCEDIDASTEWFTTEKEAEKWIASKGFINKTEVVKEICV